jgi:hypothetical protein
MKAGPKGAATAEPLTFKQWSSDRERFIGEYLITSRGHGAAGRQSFSHSPGGCG